MIAVINIMKAEYQKGKHSMRGRFIWIFPLVTLVLTLILTIGMTNSFAEGAWNWWYTALLPGMTAIIAYLAIVQEKKTNYYNLVTLSTGKRKLMLGKIIYISCGILLSNVIMFAGTTLGGMLLTTHVPVGGAVMAVLILTVTELWGVPVCLFLSDRLGMIPDLLIYLTLSIAGVLVSQTDRWYLLVSAIPSRIVCPFILVQPNGTAAEEGCPFLDMGAVVPGLCISVIWFVLFTFLYLNWFEKQEVK